MPKRTASRFTSPRTDFDIRSALPAGDAIPIEERSQDEVLFTGGWNEQGNSAASASPRPAYRARNLAFDVTPAEVYQWAAYREGDYSAWRQ